VSYAIRIFSAEKFSEKQHLNFIVKAQALFGSWTVSESTPFCDTGWTIHECCLTSENDAPDDEWVRVWITARRRVEGEEPIRLFEYEWYIDFETSFGRSFLGLAVQLRALVLAMQMLPWFLVEDIDCSFGEAAPTEFRSEEAVLAHIRRVLAEHPEGLAWLGQRGLVDKHGSLLLPRPK
jgi:hypothetical protein